MILRLILLLSLSSLATILPQDKPAISDIRSAYESFEYRQAITLSNSFLQNGDSLDKRDVNEVLLMKAVSHYALAEETQTRKCFIDMLKNEKTITLDSAEISPKIVDFFNKVKSDFLEMVPDSKPKEPATQIDPKNDTNNSLELTLLRDRYNIFQSSITKSLLLPGLGHYSLGDKTKGTILAAAYIVNAGALVYYIFDTANKETAYLSETTENSIRSAYSDYNTSYKVRNTLITSFSLLWIYAQTDLLFINNSLYFSVNPSISGISGGGLRAVVTASF